MGLIDSSGKITSRGRKVILLPLEPRLGVLLQYGVAAGIGDTAAWAAAILGGEGGGARQGAQGARRERKRGVCDGSDLLAEIAAARREGREMIARMVAQLTDRAGNERCADKHDEAATAEALGRALVTAFPDQVGVRRLETDEYLLATGERAVLSRDSRARGARLIVAVDRWSGESRPGIRGWYLPARARSKRSGYSTFIPSFCRPERTVSGMRNQRGLSGCRRAAFGRSP